jgi:ferric-dicitrate binding protein FerR (iron transport regulator)
MNRKAFSQLLKEYLNNTCTEEERRIVDQWYELLDNGNPALPEVEMDEIENNLWNKIQLSAIEKNADQIPVREKNIWWKYAAAACLVGIISLIGFVIFQNKNKKASGDSIIIAKLQEGFLEEINKSDTAKNIKLEDGSCLTIYPGTKLAFPKHFAANKREVYLDGDAFFHISKNPNRPFFVYSNQIVTQVLGTSFGIHRSDGKIEVDVKTGRVAVYEDKDHIALNEVEQKSNGVIITPNQKVTYYQHERHFVTSIVDQPKPVLHEQGAKTEEAHLYYKDTPLYKVLNDLENTYELQIVLENEKIKNCLFTGDLTGQNLFTKLEGICLVFNASYEIKGTKILLKGGKNCI